MEVIFLIYLSKSFDSLWMEMSYYLCIDVLSENDTILGSLLYPLSVCVRDCMGGFVTTHSSEP